MAANKPPELTVSHICSLAAESPLGILREEDLIYSSLIYFSSAPYSAAKVEEAFALAVSSGLCKRIGESQSIFLTLKGRESVKVPIRKT